MASRIVLVYPTFERLAKVDPSAQSLLQATAAMVDDAGVRLIVTGVPSDVELGLTALSFDTLEDALIWREDEVLKDAGLDQGGESIRLADVEVLAEIDASFLARIESAGRFCRFDAGELMCRQGDFAEEVYFLVAGRRYRSGNGRTASTDGSPAAGDDVGRRVAPRHASDECPGRDTKRLLRAGG